MYCSCFSSALQKPFELEHTTLGYLYVSGQLLTALANIYFFFMGVCLFLVFLYLIKSNGMYHHHMGVLFQHNWSKTLFKSPDHRNEEKTPEDADVADWWILWDSFVSKMLLSQWIKMSNPVFFFSTKHLKNWFLQIFSIMQFNMCVWQPAAFLLIHLFCWILPPTVAQWNSHLCAKIWKGGKKLSGHLWPSLYSSSSSSSTFTVSSESFRSG